MISSQGTVVSLAGNEPDPYAMLLNLKHPAMTRVSVTIALSRSKPASEIVTEERWSICCFPIGIHGQPLATSSSAGLSLAGIALCPRFLPYCLDGRELNRCHSRSCNDKDNQMNSTLLSTLSLRRPSGLRVCSRSPAAGMDEPASIPNPLDSGLIWPRTGVAAS